MWLFGKKKPVDGMTAYQMAEAKEVRKKYGAKAERFRKSLSADDRAYFDQVTETILAECKPYEEECCIPRTVLDSVRELSKSLENRLGRDARMYAYIVVFPELPHTNASYCEAITEHDYMNWTLYIPS